MARSGLLAAPFAVAVAVILSIYIPSGSPIEGTYRAAVISLAFVALLQGVLIPFIGLAYAAALTTSLVALVFKQQELLIGAGVLGAAAALWSRLRATPLRTTIERALPTAALLLLIGSFGAGMLAGAIGLPTFRATTELRDGDGRRDIIVVLLDGYPRSDTLASHFDLENTPFLEALEARGFEVAEESRSNYSLTALTLTSMFHMRHIPDIPELTGITGGPAGYRAVTSVLSSPLPAIELMRAHGYEAVSIPAVVNEVKLRSVDRDLDSGQLVQLETVLLGKTLLAPVLDAFAPDFVYDQQRDRSLATLAAIEELATDRQQQFVFAHLMLPHAPFVFGPNGEPLPQPECVPVCSIFEPPPDHDEWLRRIADQVAYVNGRLLALIDAIHANGDEPVIVLMSDHGSRAFAADDPDEMLRNFFAAATPDAPGLFPEDVTLVNLFPRLLGQYLDEDVPLQADRFFRSNGVGPLEIRPAE